ncbi:hypothetical protein NDU88_006092 [Pleurodeles waltl]|uniref:Uncharacterized protein n=1 Tax=Pleurodeles waltl TaxID=8319 RepID=A0AAV7ULE3_PLEWA|nr:hypothetical protein NDU88_006092 [Pleurodeles waltl]
MVKGQAPPLSPRIPLLAIPGIDRIKGQFRLAVWATKGIHTIGDIFGEGRFLPYETLARLHDLGQGGFLVHRALQRLVRNTWGNGNNEPQTSPALHKLLLGSGALSDISWIYKALQAYPEEAQTTEKTRRLSSALTHREGWRRWKRLRRLYCASEKSAVEKPARSLLLAREAVWSEEHAARLPGSLPGQDKEVSHAQAPDELAWEAERSQREAFCC